MDKDSYNDSANSTKLKSVTKNPANIIGLSEIRLSTETLVAVDTFWREFLSNEKH